MAIAALPIILEAVAAAGSVAAGTMAAVSAHETGIAQHDDALQRANQAKLEAGQKAIQMRQTMLSALATQNAAAGVSGVGTGGSFGANVNRQITQSTNDLLALNANTSSQVQQYGAQAASATAQGNVAMGTSLLDTVGGAANAGNNISAGIQAQNMNALQPVTVTATRM